MKTEEQIVKRLHLLDSLIGKLDLMDRKQLIIFSERFGYIQALKDVLADE